LEELILDRSLAGSLFAKRFLGEFSRLNSATSRASAEVEIISDEMRAVVESLWPELAHKLPHQHS
jgi:superfamily I DNA and/or RNA helicase